MISQLNISHWSVEYQSLVSWVSVTGELNMSHWSVEYQSLVSWISVIGHYWISVTGQLNISHWSVRRPSWLKSDDIPQYWAGYCFIIQQIDNKARFKSFCWHFFTSLFLPTYEATCTYTAGYLLPTDDRYREHHDHIWIVLQLVE